VEFKEAFERPVAQEKYQEASRNQGFFFLEYPKDFLDFREEVDAVILTNVLNIVPDKDDRKRILTECAKKLRRGGLMLLMCQYGEPNYGPGMTRRLKLNDGWCYNLHKRFQTFNREYSIPQLRAEIPADLFKEFQQLSSAHHRAFLFERI
jgi:SAM-dependent methyltransferase